MKAHSCQPYLYIDRMVTAALDRLGVEAVVVYLLLVSEADKTGKGRVVLGDLTAPTRLSAPKVKRALWRLEQAGLIDALYDTSREQGIQYTLTDSSSWTIFKEEIV